MMLQNTRTQLQTHYEGPDQGLDLSRYIDLLKRRILYIVVPFVLIFAAGFVVTMLLPPIYSSEGKILVETQQIPTDLVRPTVTASAKERIQVIEQRVMSRENLLAVADKFQLFADKRQRMSGTELLDVMRASTRIVPFELDQRRGQNTSVTIAVIVGFEHERPEIAMRVANELITLLLNEDARNRTNRAMETAKFLAREVKRLESELGSVEAQIAELKRRPGAAVPDASSPLAVLRADLHAKSSVYSDAHPEVIRLKRLIAALEKTAPAPVVATAGQADPVGLEALQNQRTSIQKSLDNATQKLTIANLGETLERDQFSERLQVLEQAVVPQRPIKPNRPKILALVFAVAAGIAIGWVVALEAFDNTIRGRRELFGVAEGAGIVAIPYISTRAEVLGKRRKIVLVTGTLIVLLAGGLATAHFLVRPLDQLWSILLSRLLP